MTQEPHGQHEETVVAIWNTDRTLKICLGRDIDQEETRCQCPNDHNGTACDAPAWPKDGPIVVSSHGYAHFCEDCVREIDADFVDAYEEGCDEIFARDVCGFDFLNTPDQGLGVLATFFPTSLGIIEYAPHRDNRPPQWV